jgi:hypothetical protein
MNKFSSFLRALLIGCALAAAAVAPSAATPKKNFKVAWSIYVGWMPWGYAADTGIVKKWADKYGITIEVTQFNAGPTDAKETIEIAVVGAHLSGMALNGELQALDAKLVRETTTAADYKFFALGGTVPPKPVLLRVAEGGAGLRQNRRFSPLGHSRKKSIHEEPAKRTSRPLPGRPRSTISRPLAARADRDGTHEIRTL